MSEVTFQSCYVDILIMDHIGLPTQLLLVMKVFLFDDLVVPTQTLCSIKILENNSGLFLMQLLQKRQLGRKIAFLQLVFHLYR